MELFRLFGSVIIEDDKAIATLKDAEKNAKESAKAVETLGKKASDMGKVLAVGAGAAVTALFGIAKSAADSASAIDDSSKRVGMSAEEYQKWAYAAKLSGIESDKLETIMKKQQTVFANATEGNKAASDAYQRLGINIKGLTSGDAFNKAITALADMEDETQRNALANDLFGKSYADLAPLLGSGSDGIEALKKEAQDLGMVMSNESVAAGEKFGDQMDQVTIAFKNVVAEIGIKVMPIFQKFMDWILANMPTIQAIMETVFSAISVAVEWFADNLDWLLPIMAGVLAGFVAFNIITTITSLFTLVTTAIAGAGGAMALFNAIMLANPIGLIVVAIAALVAGIVLLWTHWDDVSKLFSKTFDAIASGFEGFVNGIIGGLNWIIEKANQVAGTKIKTIGKVDLTDANNKLGKITGYQSPNKLAKYSAVADFADGGLAYGETAVNVGEYAGAKTNPEVIAPLDKLKDIISGTGKNITVNFYPQTMSENELENAFQYMNRKFGMEV